MKKKITPKKKVQKSYPTDEVKRYLGSLSEDFQGKVSAIGEQMVGLFEQTKAIRETQEEHSKILTHHTQILNHHSQLLGHHSELLANHSEMIGRLLLDVHDIKNEKVGHSDFSRLEKRVLKIENRLHGVRGT